MADAGLVESFMEVTSCGSESVAVTHLSSCGWLLEDAINLYFSAAGPLPAGDPHPIPGPAHGDTTLYEGDVDQVRAPIPARSETLLLLLVPAPPTPPPPSGRRRRRHLRRRFSRCMLSIRLKQKPPSGDPAATTASRKVKQPTKRNK